MNGVQADHRDHSEETRDVEIDFAEYLENFNTQVKEEAEATGDAATPVAAIPGAPAGWNPPGRIP